MRKALRVGLTTALLLSTALAQTPQKQQQQPRETAPDDIIRITTELVQADVVVADKNDEIISDLKLSDFEVYDNGKKQELQFMEFISVDEPGRSEGAANNIARIAPGVDSSVAKDTTAADLRRVIGFV